MFAETYYWGARNHGIEAATIPGTNEIVRGGATEQTWDAWTKRCAQLGLDFPNPIRTFQDCGCLALDPERRAMRCRFIDDDAPERIRQPRLIGIGDVIRFAETAVDWFKSDDTVPQELAEKRAETCMLCPHNSEPSGGGCASCTGLAQKLASKVFSVLGGKSTTHDRSLRACDRCQCSLAIMVHTPLAVLLKHQEGVLELPPYCWKVTESA